MKKLFTYTLCVLAFSSCKKYLDVNDTPNNPLDVTPRLILPNTTVGIAWMNGNQLGKAASVLVQYNAGLSGDPDAFDGYRLEGNFENQWNNEIYSATISDLRILIAKTEATSPAYSGIAKIQLAYAFSLTTDLWGDVPYSQAGIGLDFSQPRFDKQQDIYLGNPSSGIQSLFSLVRDGLADLDKPSLFKPGADDVAYGGDLSKWKKMGNTLLLKFAIQVSNVAPDTTRSVINNVIAGNNYIKDNAEDFQIGFKTSPFSQNPMYAFDYANRPNEEMLSLRFLNLMKSMNDTIRLAKFYTKPNGVFAGYDNGATVVAPVLANRSRYGPYVVGTGGEAPIRLITNFQRAFILAESALLFGTPGVANELYQEGIKASMRKTGMADAEINTYFNDNPTIVNLTGTTEDQHKQIITQKYIAWVGNGIEAYNDFRRTGYPPLALALNVTGDDPNTIPKRFPYTDTERQRNPNQQNPRPRTSEKVWWGK